MEYPPNIYVKPKIATTILGVSRETLRTKYKEFGIRRKNYGTHFRYHAGDCKAYVQEHNQPEAIKKTNDPWFEKRIRMILKKA